MRRKRRKNPNTAETHEPDLIEAVIDDSYTAEEYAAFMEERKALIDAARESARTFDQAVLAFGSAVFAGSIAFLKDVAPHPAAYTMKWLALAWTAFATGLLCVLLSFLFSHRACMFEIDIGTAALGKGHAARAKNLWSNGVDVANGLCVTLLIVGLSFWAVFALENLAWGEQTVNKSSAAPHIPEKVEKGYIPPKAPPPPPKQQLPTPSNTGKR